MKRLVCCLDGTWNTPDQEGNPTSVTRIMRAIRPVADDGTQQIVFYDKGVGTGGWLNRLRGGALGRGLGENVCDAYRFLVNNHEPGDEIYVFGFSRGAFTARSLCGLVGRIGLLPDEREYTTEDAWDAYRSPAKDPDREGRLDAIADHAITDVHVRLVGVWDTVGALGIPNDWFTWNMRRRYAFHNTQLGHGIDHAFHALAIDERRGPFVPTLWRLPPGEALPATDEAGPDETRTVVEQVWFPGVHTDIGGGYADNRLSNAPLDWMIRRARETTGLAFHDGTLPGHDALAPAHESRTLSYLASRLLPMLRVIGGVVPPVSWHRGLRARLREARMEGVGVNEFLHRSALDRRGREVETIEGEGRSRSDRYEPANLDAVRQRLPVVEYDGTITRGA